MRRRSREELLDEVVGLITAGLATRNDDELESLIDVLGEAQFAGHLEQLPATDGSIMVHVNPLATKESIVGTLLQLVDWIEENWEEEPARLQLTPGFEVALGDPSGNDLPN